MHLTKNKPTQNVNLSKNSVMQKKQFFSQKGQKSELNNSKVTICQVASNLTNNNQLRWNFIDWAKY